MKKVVFVLAMAAVSASVSAVELGIYKDKDTKVTLFGEVRTRYAKVTQSVSGDHKLRFSMDCSRLGVQGTHKLSDTANALGYIRLRYKDDETSSSSNKFNVDKSWMGISTGFGTFKVGRIASIQDEDMSFYDVTSEFGGGISPHGPVAGTGLQDGVLEYSWNNDNFRIRAQYFPAATRLPTTDDLSAGGTRARFHYFAAATQGPPQSDLSVSFDHGFAVGGSWTADFGLGLHFAYTAAYVDDLMFGTDLAAGSAMDKRTISLGASYTLGGLSLAATTSDLKSEAKPLANAQKLETRGVDLGSKC